MQDYLVHYMNQRGDGYQMLKIFVDTNIQQMNIKKNHQLVKNLEVHVIRKNIPKKDFVNVVMVIMIIIVY